MKAYLYEKLDFKGSAVLKFFRLPLFVIAAILLVVSIWLVVKSSTFGFILTAIVLLVCSFAMAWLAFVSEEVFVHKNAEFMANHMTRNGGLFSSGERSLSDAILNEFGVADSKSNDPELNQLSEQLDQEEKEAKEALRRPSGLFSNSGMDDHS